MSKIAVLYDAGQAGLSRFDLDEVLQRILAIARDYFHLQNVAILLVDRGRQQVVVRAEIGWDDGQDEIRLDLGKGLTGVAAVKKQPVYAPDVRKDPRYLCSAKSTRSELAVPLMVRDEVVGVLDCQSDRINHFDNDTIDLLTLFSTQASMALQNARLYSLERQRARQLQAINAIAQQSTAVLVLEECYSGVSLPLVPWGQVVGVMRLHSSSRGAFGEMALQSVEWVADICPPSIQTPHYVERVKHLFFLGGLTGFFNRRFFELRIM